MYISPLTFVHLEDEKVIIRVNDSIYINHQSYYSILTYFKRTENCEEKFEINQFISCTLVFSPYRHYKDYITYISRNFRDLLYVYSGMM